MCWEHHLFLWSNHFFCSILQILQISMISKKWIFLKQLKVFMVFFKKSYFVYFSPNFTITYDWFGNFNAAHQPWDTYWHHKLTMSLTSFIWFPSKHPFWHCYNAKNIRTTHFWGFKLARSALWTRVVVVVVNATSIRVFAIFNKVNFRLLSLLLSCLISEIIIFFRMGVYITDTLPHLVN